MNKNFKDENNMKYFFVFFYIYKFIFSFLFKHAWKFLKKLYSTPFRIIVDGLVYDKFFKKIIDAPGQVKKALIESFRNFTGRV